MKIKSLIAFVLFVSLNSLNAETLLPTINIKVPDISNVPSPTSIKNYTVYGDFSGSYKGRTYQFIYERISWHQAKLTAEQMGGHLACVDSADKLSYIQSLRLINNNMQPVWVGLTDEQHEGRWRWLCDKPMKNGIKHWLDRGEDLDSRDYGHLMARKGFLSRTNSGSRPYFENGFKTSKYVSGFIVEFAEKPVQGYQNLTHQTYQERDPALFEQVMTLRASVNHWRGGANTLTLTHTRLSELLKQHDDFAPLYLALGETVVRQGMINSNNYQRGKLAIAESHFHKAIQLAPTYAEAYLSLADMLTKAKRYDEAQSALKNALQLNSNELDLHMAWGYLRSKKRQSKTAIDHYQTVLALASENTPQYARALGQLASLNTRLDNYVKANEFHQQLLDIRPNDAWIRGNYGSFLLYNQQDVSAAISMLREAVALMDYGIARNNLALALYTKWAELKDNPSTQEQAELYFYEAYNINSNMRYLISKLSRYDFSKPAAAALQQWQITYPDGKPLEPKRKSI